MPVSTTGVIVAGIDGYVVLANINSTHQVVLGGATEAVARAVAAVQERGHTAIPLPVSHGFHTEIVAPASGPLRAMLQKTGHKFVSDTDTEVLAHLDQDGAVSGDARNDAGVRWHGEAGCMAATAAAPE